MFCNQKFGLFYKQVEKKREEKKKEKKMKKNKEKKKKEEERSGVNSYYGQDLKFKFFTREMNV